MVRNEVDIVRLNVLYHLSLGVDRVIVADNGSTDGTDEVLRQMSAEDERVRWRRDEGSFLPSRIATELAREAFEEGADWLLPVDADEFWHVPRGDLRSVLEGSKAGALIAPVVNFIQRRGQEESSPDALLHMTRRVATPIGPPGVGQDLVEARKIAFVEKMYPPKNVSRPTAEIEIQTGNHSVSGVNGPKERTDRLICLHAPIRSRDSLAERVRSARRAGEAGRKEGQGRNRRRLAELGEAGIQAEWEANSYRNNALDVYGERHPVIFDPRLRDAVSPFVAQPSWKKLLRPLDRFRRG